VSASKPQIRAIHSLRAAAGLNDEDAYRDFLEQQAGVRSSKDLSGSAAVAVIDRLKVLSGQPQRHREKASKARGALRLDGPYAGICRALWISGWNLGVVEHREDTALVAFVRRQTGVDLINWVKDAAEGRAIVEALKAWLAREAGVEWPKRNTAMSPSGKSIDLRKWAVVKAQLRLLGDSRRIPANADLDALMSELGVEVRALPRAEVREVC
jgi:hypothetical protein